MVRPRGKHLACASSMPPCRPSCTGAERSARARRAGSTREEGAAAAAEASATGPRPWRWRGGRGGRKRQGRTTAPPCSSGWRWWQRAPASCSFWELAVTRDAAGDHRQAGGEGRREWGPCLAAWASWGPPAAAFYRPLAPYRRPWDKGSLGRGFGHVGALSWRTGGGNATACVDGEEPTPRCEFETARQQRKFLVPAARKGKVDAVEM